MEWFWTAPRIPNAPKDSPLHHVNIHMHVWFVTRWNMFLFLGLVWLRTSCFCSVAWIKLLRTPRFQIINAISYYSWMTKLWFSEPNYCHLRKSDRCLVTFSPTLGVRNVQWYRCVRLHERHLAVFSFTVQRMETERLNLSLCLLYFICCSINFFFVLLLLFFLNFLSLHLANFISFSSHMESFDLDGHVVLPPARHSHTASLCGNRMYVLGGTDRPDTAGSLLLHMLSLFIYLSCSRQTLYSYFSY